MSFRKTFLLLLAFADAGFGASVATFDVRQYGAKGDGRTLDTAAINAAIAAAQAAGGGTVRFPAGTYASFSIHLQSNVTLYLDAGATLLAAEPPADLSGGYDAAEPNEWSAFQDFGHSHWHNSLIWGEALTNISIVGLGRIDGRGLSKGAGLRDPLPEERDAGTKIIPYTKSADAGRTLKQGPFGYPNPKDTLPDGVGNKAIALKNCRNVVLRDFTMYHAGHFAVLATGVDNLTVDGLRLDTNRDGIDVDCCRSVRISNCVVNSQFDDGICLKSSFALGRSLPCEDVTISNCHVSGYDEGSLLDGTYRKESKHSIKGGPVGRIKCGTESNGGYRNVTITNCQFDFCRGLALETVDGGWLEDITVSNLTMRDIVSTPIYVRLGHRGRTPEGRDKNGKPAVAPGELRRVHISQVVAHNPNSFQGILIDGTNDSPIEDLSLADIYIDVKGGGAAELAHRQVEEMDQVYPEPFHWGALPAWGLWARHVRNLTLRNVELRSLAADGRPPIALVDVQGVTGSRVRASAPGQARLLQLNDVPRVHLADLPSP